MRKFSSLEGILAETLFLGLSKLTWVWASRMRRAKDIDGLPLARLILATVCYETSDAKPGSPSMELILDSFPHLDKLRCCVPSGRL